MAYVVPNSIVQLFQGVPLNKDADDTILFTAESLQNIYFAQNLRATFTAENFTFIKKETQTIRVEANYGKVYQCNYLRYNNTANANKWIYAFITDINYINENVTEISFEIDRLQTWLPGIDYNLTECYVEREHSASDIIGEHILEEGLDLGLLEDEQIYQDPFTPVYLGVMLSSISSSLPLIPPVVFNSIYDRTPVGYILLMFDYRNGTEAEEFKKILKDPMTNQNILGGYTIPYEIISTDDLVDWNFEGEGGITHNVKILTSQNLEPVTLYIPRFLPENGLNGYMPKNNKLFCYPYNRVVVSNSKGSTNEYRYEGFKQLEDDQLPFLRICSTTTPVSASIMPKNYLKTGLTDMHHNGCKTENKLSMSVSAIGGYTGDLFLANLMQQVPNVLGTVFNAGVGAVTGNVYSIKEAIQGAGNVAGNLLSTKNNDVTANKTSNPDNIDVANDFLAFDFYRRTITPEYAERIDNFFSAYGYRYDGVKIPNINVRQKWTYTKTSDANFISKNVPADDMKIINEKFNRGIRFHKNYASIGNITQENPTL